MPGYALRAMNQAGLPRIPSESGQGVTKKPLQLTLGWALQKKHSSGLTRS